MLKGCHTWGPNIISVLNPGFDATSTIVSSYNTLLSSCSHVSSTMRVALILAACVRPIDIELVSAMLMAWPIDDRKLLDHDTTLSEWVMKYPNDANAILLGYSQTKQWTPQLAATIRSILQGMNYSSIHASDPSVTSVLPLLPQSPTSSSSLSSSFSSSMISPSVSTRTPSLLSHITIYIIQHAIEVLQSDPSITLQSALSRAPLSTTCERWQQRVTVNQSELFGPFTSPIPFSPNVNTGNDCNNNNNSIIISDDTNGDDYMDSRVPLESELLELSRVLPSFTGRSEAVTTRRRHNRLLLVLHEGVTPQQIRQSGRNIRTNVTRGHLHATTEAPTEYTPSEYRLVDDIEQEFREIKWMLCSAGSGSTSMPKSTTNKQIDDGDDDDYGYGLGEDDSDTKRSVVRQKRVRDKPLSIEWILPRSLLILIGQYLPWFDGIQMDPLRQHVIDNMTALERRVQRLEQQLALQTSMIHTIINEQLDKRIATLLSTSTKIV
jgi:hypothetical protein